MTVQAGRDLLLKIDKDGTGNYVTFAGLRTTRLTLNAGSIDVTTIESEGGWRELLGGGGMKSAQIAGSGVFRDELTDARARQLFFDGEIPSFQIIIPHFGVIEGSFQITSIEYSGGHDSEATYELSLASAGQLKFVAIQ
ncbi:phage major tail protein, TP901-1 family [uncultured Jannaschia sp.]|uniref:phage major tail protein, TP901-1 family n=1 Tax=uncultured Jannaschia sp. TaxID=293347 RepID=UPI0026250FDA|nr:phage major tail protein, TP901-1 family [uncultured Jannaschia sp.]